MEHGMDDYLSKPLNMEKMVQMITEEVARVRTNTK